MKGQSGAEETAGPFNGAGDDPRHRALGVLYEMDISGGAPPDLEGMLEGAPSKAGRIVRGVAAETGRIDAIIERAAQDWKAARMPAIDRAVLRMGVYELLHHSRTPVAVIISEAVRIAGEFSTGQSSRFVNGVLATLAGWIRPDSSGGAARAGGDPFGARRRRRTTPGLLVTADGEVFRGWSVGAEGATVGKWCSTQP